MTRPRTRNSLLFLLVFILPVFLLVSCDDPTCPTCGPGGGGEETVDLSGKVLDLTTSGPIGGATVEFADGSRSTTTSEEGCDDDPPAESCGSWTLADVPTPEPNENPRIRITAAGYADSYNNFPFALGIRQYDLMILSSAGFGFLPPAMAAGAPLPDGGCLVMGVVVRFVGDPTVYPQSVDQLADAEVIVVPDDLTVVYFGPAAPPFGALPDPNLTKTSALGLFGIVVPDATGETGVTSITLSGTGLAGGLSEVSPDSFVLVGLIDVS